MTNPQPWPSIVPIPATNEIQYYIHCSKCYAELPTNTTPADYQRLAVGFTELGIQVWCTRHNCDIMHIDFKGICYSANVKVYADEK